jgi:probable rRNA maturation factor
MSRPVPERGRPGDEPEGPQPSRRPRRRGPEGSLHVFAADEQADHAVDVDRWTRLAHDALTDEGVSGEAELSLLFVDEGSMAELNQRFMEKVGPTDVLAFPIDETGPIGRWPDAGTTGPDRDEDQIEAPLLLGDVVLCPAVAARQAVDHSVTVDDELALLVVHGVLHVLGYDHAEADEAARMQARERELLERFHHRRS